MDKALKIDADINDFKMRVEKKFDSIQQRGRAWGFILGQYM